MKKFNGLDNIKIVKKWYDRVLDWLTYFFTGLYVLMLILLLSKLLYICIWKN